MNGFLVGILVAASGVAGCGSRASDEAQGQLHGDAGVIGKGGTGGGGSGGGGGGGNGGCGPRDAEFQAFVAAHRFCDQDSDCAVVGDCGPNADFTPVRSDVADEAYLKMQDRCTTAWDGPTYDPVCRAGVCALQSTGSCCGCPSIDDAGRDGSDDASIGQDADARDATSVDDAGRDGSG